MTEQRTAYLFRWALTKGPVIAYVRQSDLPEIWLADGTTFACVGGGTVSTSAPLACHEDELAFSEDECRSRMQEIIAKEEAKLVKQAAKLAKLRAKWDK